MKVCHVEGINSVNEPQAGDFLHIVPEIEGPLTEEEALVVSSHHHAGAHQELMFDLPHHPIS